MKKKLAILLLSLPISSQALANGDPWSSSRLYEKGDNVSHRGSKYSAKFDSTDVEPEETPSWMPQFRNPWEKKKDDVFPAEAFNILKPLEGQTLFIGDTLEIFISPSRPDIESIRIEFNGKRITEMTRPPFSYAFIPDVLPGDASLIVIEKHDRKEQVQVRNITFISRFIPEDSDNEPAIPEVPAHFITPQNGQSFDLGETVLIKLGVPEREEITPIQIFDNNVPIAMLSHSPFEFPWAPQYAGGHQLVLIQRINNQDTFSTVSVNITEKAPVTNELKIESNIKDGFYAEVNKEITLSATVLSGTPEYLSFLMDGEEFARFDSPPYSLKWTPATLGYYEFSIKGRNENEYRNLDLFRAVIPVLSKESVAFCKATPAWETGIYYSPGDNVEHQGGYFSAYRYNAEEPKYYSNGAAGSGHPWNIISCEGMLSETRPSISFYLNKQIYNEGDDARLEINLRSYPRDSVSTKEVTITDDKGVIQRLTKPPFVYTTKIEKSRKQIKIKATNSLGLSAEGDVLFNINASPFGDIDFQQGYGYGSSVFENSSFEIVVTAIDMDGWVRYVEFYIDGIQVDGKAVSRPSQGLEKYVRSRQKLSAGEYEVKVTLIDTNDAKTDIKRKLLVKPE